MVEFIGSDSIVTYAGEAKSGVKPTAYGGTTGATTQKFVGITNSTITTPDPEFEIKKYRSFGAGREWYKLRPGRASLSGSMTISPTSPEIFHYAFGKETISGTTHTLEAKVGAFLPSFSFAVHLGGSPNFDRLYRGCVINRMTLNLNAGEELQADLEIMALAADQGTDLDIINQTPVSATCDDDISRVAPYMFYDTRPQLWIGNSNQVCADYNPANGAVQNARAFARVENFSATINNNLKTKYYISENGQFPFNYLTSYPDFELSCDVVPAGFQSGDEDSVYDILTSQQNIPYIVLPFRKIGAEQMDIVFKDCRLSSAPHSLPDDGGEVRVSCRFEPRKMYIVVRDTTSAAYNVFTQ